MAYGTFTNTNIQQAIKRNNQPDHEKMDVFIGRLLADVIESEQVANPDFANIKVIESYDKTKLSTLLDNSQADGIIMIIRSDSPLFTVDDSNVAARKGTSWTRQVYTFNLRMKFDKQNRGRAKRILDKLRDYLSLQSNIYQDSIRGSQYASNLELNQVISRVDPFDEAINETVFLKAVLTMAINIYQPQ